MKRWSFLWAFLVVGTWMSVASAMDWKALHEKADREDPAALMAMGQKPSATQEDVYAAGLAALNLYRISEAEAFFRKILARDASSFEAQWGLAEIMRRRHQIDEAEPLLEEIIKKSPGYAPAYVTLGYMLFDKDEYERAMSLGYRVLRLGQDRVDRTNYVRAYLIIGGAKGMIADQGGPFSKLIQGTQVMGYLRRAQRLDPTSPGVYFGIGSFYALAPAMAGGDVAKGIALLEKAVEADPNFADAHARLAQVWFARGDKEKYRSYLAKAEALDPQGKLVLKVKALKDPAKKGRG